MVTVKRPERIFSFSDHQLQQPNRPPPGDRLDAQFMELVDAIKTTQDALAQIRRDDGLVKAPTKLEPHLMQELIDTFTAKITPTATQVTGQVANARHAADQAQLYAADAEAAVATATQLVNGMAALRQLISKTSAGNDVLAQTAEMFATEAENWANYSHAQADNSSTSRYEALQWAEYLAGPVVDALAAPEYIPTTPFPHGLFYQTIEGGVAGLWSAKWWALQAYNLVGMFSQFYLGPWDHGPLPGEQNPITGIVAPNPILAGSIYYNTVTHQIYVWNGTEWVSITGLYNGSVQGSYIYIATANQQDFFGPDFYGSIPVVGLYPSQVLLNGVRLLGGTDFTVNATTNRLHITTPVTAGSVVMWDLLKEPVIRSAINGHKIIDMEPDGIKHQFTLRYLSPVDLSTKDANVGTSVELFVILDGIPQEPGIDFDATGNTLHMLLPVGADAHFWAVWYQPVTEVIGGRGGTVGDISKMTVLVPPTDVMQ